MARLPIPGSDNGTWGDVLNDYLLVAHSNDGALKDNSITNAKLNTGSGADGQVLTKDSGASGVSAGLLRP